jgi:hypothetical protein
MPAAAGQVHARSRYDCEDRQRSLIVLGCGWRPRV